MEVQQPVQLSPCWSCVVAWLPWQFSLLELLAGMEGVCGLSCLAPYLSEVPVTPFWCALGQLRCCSTHWCSSALLFLARAGGHCPALHLSHTVLELPQLCWSGTAGSLLTFRSRGCCGLASTAGHPWLCSALENPCQPLVLLLSCCSRSRTAVLCLQR